MRRFLTCILTLAALLALTAPARADILWEPDDNAFYKSHREECSAEDRAYIANGGDGFVTAWDAPGGSQVRFQHENGERLWVSFVYQEWGLLTLWKDHKEISGWAPLVDLFLVYDYISFDEEFADQITDYNGEFAGYDGSAEAVNFYAYPGAPEISQTFEGSLGLTQNLTGSEDQPSYITRIFVDEEGLTWGFVTYMFGRQNAWFCLDNPGGTDFPVRAVPQPELIPPRPPELPSRSYGPYVLVGAVVLVTGALLLCFYGKRRKNT